MKRIQLILTITITAVVIFISCDDEVTGLLPPQSPTNVAVTIEVAQDSSGNVIFTPTANNVLTFQISPGDGSGPFQVVPGTSLEHTYPGDGLLQFNPVVVAFGTGGASSSIIDSVEVFIVARVPDEVVISLAGGLVNSTKRWVWDQNTGGVNGHFGVGSPDTDFPGFFAADPNLLNDCLYDDVIEFSTNDSGVLSYNLITQGLTFVNAGQIGVLFPGESAGADECRDADDILVLQTSVSYTENEVGNPTLALGGGALSPLSYFANVPEWEVVQLTDGVLRVRGLNAAGDLAWYHQFIPEGSDSGEGGREDFNTLIFEDDFTDATLDESVWNFELGDGCDQPAGCGWGNQESQNYTSRSDNLFIQDGILNIRAVREDFGGSQYTSARINTKGKFEFTFGRVDVRARVSNVGGAWPAAWMLGADIDTNPWPGAGEIDVMEHRGNEPDRIFGTTHSPSGFGGTANGSSTTVSDATTEFHIYSIDWTENFISFYVDDELYFTYEPSTINDETFPFRKDFFLLLNQAVGGTFGGDIDPAFSESVFEIDYVRVYQ